MVLLILASSTASSLQLFLRKWELRGGGGEMESPQERGETCRAPTPGWGMPTNTAVSVRQITTSGPGEAHSLFGVV